MNVKARSVDRIRFVALKILGEIAGFTNCTAHELGFWAENAEERICRAKFACRCYRPPDPVTYVKVR